MTPPASPAARCPSRRPEYMRGYDLRSYAAHRQLPTVPLRAGGWCVYRGPSDLRLMRVLHISGGVAKLERDGCRFEAACATVRGVKL